MDNINVKKNKTLDGDCEVKAILKNVADNLLIFCKNTLNTS